jgi:hypothetical protein
MQGSPWLYIPNTGVLMGSLIVASRTISGVFKRFGTLWHAANFLPVPGIKGTGQRAVSSAALIHYISSSVLVAKESLNYIHFLLSIYHTLSLSKLIILF